VTRQLEVDTAADGHDGEVRVVDCRGWRGHRRGTCSGSGVGRSQPNGAGTQRCGHRVQLPGPGGHAGMRIPADQQRQYLWGARADQRRSLRSGGEGSRQATPPTAAPTLPTPTIPTVSAPQLGPPPTSGRDIARLLHGGPGPAGPHSAAHQLQGGSAALSAVWQSSAGDQASQRIQELSQWYARHGDSDRPGESRRRLLESPCEHPDAATIRGHQEPAQASCSGERQPGQPGPLRTGGVRGADRTNSAAHHGDRAVRRLRAQCGQSVAGRPRWNRHHARPPVAPKPSKHL
jgi:hypothetical protein